MRLLIGATAVAALCAAASATFPPVLTTVRAAINEDPMRSPPLLESSAAWRWVTSAPGVNYYIASRHADGQYRQVSVWVDEKYFGNIAEIEKDRLELMQFDCGRGIGRQVSSGVESRPQFGRARIEVRDSPSDWQREQPGSAIERLSDAVCRADTSGARKRSGLDGLESHV